MTGKQLHHIVRLYQFLQNLIFGKTFKESLVFFNEAIKSMCMDAKLNKYSLQEARKLGEYFSVQVHDLKELYLSQNEVEIKEEVVNLLLSVKTKIFKQYFKEQLLPDYKEPYKLCPDHYKKVWVTSDTHFGHKNILMYEDRYAKLNIKNIEEHDQELIRRWNSVVHNGDLVIVLGDFSFKSAKDTNILLKQLNGDKVLVRGNHDIFLDNKNFDKTLFKAIYDYKEVKYKGQELVLMHYPIMSFKHQGNNNKSSVLLFGHIHSAKCEIPKYSFNVGVDVNEYYPIDLNYAIWKALNNI